MTLESARTDWLGSKNIFYNVRTGVISDNINDLITRDRLTFHPEGLRNYLRYGYTVFGQTPIEDIKMLSPNERVFYNADGKIVISKEQDPFEFLLDKNSTVEDTLDYMSSICNTYIDSSDEEQYIVPTSGGFDSRWINTVIERKDKLHAFSYGLCEKQFDSYEVVYARELCKILNIKWNAIELDNFHEKTDEWVNLFGVSTHAHGMYQMEFYDKIKKEYFKTGTVISGIFGDIWAGSWQFDGLNGPEDLYNFSKTHGMNADPDGCSLEESHELRDKYWNENKEKLKDERWRILQAGRTKIPLISYLLRGPESYGFKVWSPFLDAKLVAMMLNLPSDMRKGRRWQVDYFRKVNVLIGELNLECDKTNVLDYQEYKKHPLPPLNPEITEKIIYPEYVLDINRGISDQTRADWSKWYGAYLTLYPLQSLLKQANV